MTLVAILGWPFSFGDRRRKNHWEETRSFYNFEINERLRLALAFNNYYKEFANLNVISKKQKYSNNKKLYIKLRKFIKFVNTYKITENKHNTNCCRCCKCNKKYLINEYQIKYIPYLENLEKIMKETEFDLFL